MSTAEQLLEQISGAFERVTERELSLKRLLLGGIVLAICLIVVVPLVFLVWSSVWSGSPGELGGQFTLQNLRAVYFEGFFDIPTLLANSLTIAVVMTVVGSVFGLIFAWLLVNTNLPTKSTLELALLSGQAVPGYIYAFIYLTTFDEKFGLVPVFLRQAVGAGFPFALATPVGAGFVVGITVMPTFYLLIVPALQDMNPALEEVSRVHGADTWATLREVTIPLIKPAILAGALVVFLYGLGEFSVGAIFGGRGGFDVFSTEIYEAIGTRYPPSYGEGAALASSLIVVMAVLVIYYRSVTSRKEDYMTLTGEGRRTKTWDLGRWRWPIALCLWAWMFVVWILPLGVMVMVSLHETWRGTISLSGLSLSYYVDAITSQELVQAFTNSILVSVGGATLGTVLVVGMAYYTERTDGRYRGLVDFFALAPQAIPGIIMGTGLLFTFLWVGNILPPLSLYGSLWIIVIGCVLVYIPVSSRMAVGNIVQIHSELEEAARVAGASWIQQMRDIFLPLFQNTMIVIWFFLAIHIFQLLSIPAMTYTADTVVIPIRLFRLYSSNFNIEYVSAISTIFVALTMLVVLLLRYAGITFYDLGTR